MDTLFSDFTAQYLELNDIFSMLKISK